MITDSSIAKDYQLVSETAPIELEVFVSYDRRQGAGGHVPPKFGKHIFWAIIM